MYKYNVQLCMSVLVSCCTSCLAFRKCFGLVTKTIETPQYRRFIAPPPPPHNNFLWCFLCPFRSVKQTLLNQPRNQWNTGGLSQYPRTCTGTTCMYDLQSLWPGGVGSNPNAATMLCSVCKPRRSGTRRVMTQDIVFAHRACAL